MFLHNLLPLRLRVFKVKKHEPAKLWKIQRIEAGKRGQNIVCFYFCILHLAIDSIKELLLGEGDREEFRQLAGVTLQNVCSFALPFFRKLNWVMPTFTVLQKYALHIMHKNVFLMRIFFSSNVFSNYSVFRLLQKKTSG